MKIISKHRDYYDSAIGYGQDPTLVYVRAEKNINLNTNYKIFHWGTIQTGRIKAGMIGFCGKIYPWLQFLHSYWDYYHNKNIENPALNRYVYSANNALDILKNHAEDFRYTEFTSRKVYNREEKWLYSNVSNFFIEDYFTKDYSEFNYLFRAHNAPVFSLHYDYYNRTHILTINPILKNYEFQTVIDSYQAFQEISMYLGGILGTGNPTPPKLSDEILIESKGFNLKTSFRKGKSSAR